MAAPARAVAPGAACQPAAAGQFGGVDVHDAGPGGAVQWCSYENINAAPDVTGELYFIDGSPQPQSVTRALSIDALLADAGVDPATVGHLDITRADGSSATLTPADLIVPEENDFLSHLSPIIIAATATDVEYLRPERSESDENSLDDVHNQSGQPLDLYVHTGNLLTVTVTPPASGATVGQPATFTVATDGTPADQPVAYTWTFGDGSSAVTGDAPLEAHTYDAAGTYPVVVSAVGAGDSGGTSAPVEEQVAPATATATTGTGTGTATSPPTTGPFAPAPGPAAVAPPPALAPTATATAKSPSDGSGQAASPTAQVPPRHKLAKALSGAKRADPRTASVLGSPRVTNGGISPFRAGGDAPTTSTPVGTISARAQTTSREQRPSRTSAAPGRASGTHVEGRLLTGLTVRPAGQLLSALADDDAKTSASATGGGGSPSPLNAVGGGTLVLALLTAGAASELRSRRRAVANPWSALPTPTPGDPPLTST